MVAVWVLAALAIAFAAYGSFLGRAHSGSRLFMAWWLFAAIAAAGAVAIATRAWATLPLAARACIVGAAIGFVTWVVVLSCVIMARGRRKAPDDLDVIIVLGARVKPDGTASATLQSRIDAAAAYLRAHPSCRCILSGGTVRMEGRSEASCMADGLLAHGVDSSRVELEDRSTTTVENMRFSREMLRQGDRVGIVTSDFHLYRALGIARREGIEDPRGIPARSPRLTLPHNLLRECLCLADDFFKGRR